MKRQTSTWMAAVLAVFVVQNHCGVPGVAHDQLAAHLLDRGQSERALREARRAVREQPAETTPRVLLSLALADVGRTEEAAEAVSEALRIDPDDPRLYSTLRSICVDGEREDLALQTLRQLADERPDHWLLRLNLGWAHRSVGNDDEALQLLESVVATADSSAPADERVLAQIELSHAYADLDRFDEALAVLDGALATDPADTRLLVTAGDVLIQRQRPDEARSYFDRALIASEDRAATASGIAMLFYNAGDRHRAIDYYEKAVAVRSSPLTMNNLAWTYAEADSNLDRAQDLSLRAVKADADNVVYLDTYAEVLFRQGRQPQAVALMRRCLELEPEDGDQYEYLQEQLSRFLAAGSLP